MNTDFDTSKIERLYKEGLSTYKISNQVEPCRSTVRKYIKEESTIELRGPSNYTSGLNQRVFKNPNNEGKYWVGFLMADGSITGDKIILSIQNRDIEHLYKYKKFVGYNPPPYKVNTPDTKQDQNRIGYQASRMAKHLREHGICERKVDGTKVNKLQNNRHFWRGMIDGDGTINKPGRCAVIGLYGCKTILEQFKEYTQKFVDSDTKLLKRKGTTYSHRINGSNALKVMQKLYCNQGLSLERKERRAFSHLGSHTYAKTESIYNDDHTLKEKP